MPSGDHTLNLGNVSNRTVDPNVGPNVGPNDPDKGTGVVSTKLGNNDVTIKTSNEHIDSLKPNTNVPTQDSSPNVNRRESDVESMFSDKSDDYGSYRANSYTPPAYLLKNRGIKVKTGAFLGSMAGIAGVGIGAVSSAGFAAKLALVGGVVGTAIFPGAGTVAGAVIGGLIGALAGGAGGAVIGALLVKGGGAIKSFFSKPETTGDKAHFNRVLDDVKEQYAFGSKAFNRLAKSVQIDPATLNSERQEIDEKFAAIVDQFKERGAGLDEDDSMASLPLPTEDFIESALVGLMKIFSAPEEHDGGFDQFGNENSARDDAVANFADLLEYNPQLDAPVIDTVADAFVYILTSPDLDYDAKSMAVDEFTGALAARLEEIAEFELNQLEPNDIAAMVESACGAALAHQSIYQELSGDYLAAERLALAWQTIARPFVEIGRSMDEAFVNAILGPLANLYDSDIRESTKEYFNEFVWQSSAPEQTIDQKATQTVAKALLAMDDKWVGTNEGLAAAQKNFVTWAGTQMTLGRDVTTDRVNEYFNQNYLMND